MRLLQKILENIIKKYSKTVKNDCVCGKDVVSPKYTC